MERRAGSSLALPIGVSALLHAAVAALLVVVPREKPVALPPIYKVDIVAAPPGERAIGVVRPTATPPAPDQPVTPPPAKASTSPKDIPLPNAKPVKRPVKAATPTPEAVPPKQATNAATAGGGPTGGTGSDVATVRTEGIDFPFPGYLNNIVRQISLNFKPKNPAATLRAEVFFMIHRDGTVTGFKFLSRSGNFAFDLEAQGAVEAVGNARGFGALPGGFTQDILPVVFSFDPKLVR